jgi:uncharacterized membrane protein YvlD (DUF360 family)
MLQDLKLSQYAKLPPRATFTAQMLGTIVGAILNWVMMNSIVDNQREILLSVEGTNIWSGQNVQSYNAQAIAWGGVGHKIFSGDGTYLLVPIGLVIGLFAPLPFWVIHKFYPKLRLDSINTSIIATWLGWLSVGINASLLLDRSLLSRIPPKEARGALCQVQHDCHCCYWWWCSNHRVHPDVRRLRWQWNCAPIPNLVG